MKVFRPANSPRGATGGTFRCSGDTIYDDSKQYCNWVSSVTCIDNDEEVDCPPERIETDSPTQRPTFRPVTQTPVSPTLIVNVPDVPDGTINDNILSPDDNEDDCNTVEKSSPEMCIGALYYLKTTSPYNSTLWKLKTADKEWEVVSHLPHSLDRYPAFQTGEMNTDVLVSMPDSEFKDFSCEIGQSAIAFSEAGEASNSLKMEFSEELLTPEMYDKKVG